MELLKQIRIAFIGSPDTGKSTIIKHIIESLTGRILSPDTLMSEVHYSDGTDPDGNPDTRTIKCAKIMFKYKDFEYCFYDAPGHLEYIDQIRQAVTSADLVVRLYNSNNLDVSYKYFSELSNLKVADISKPCIILYSHSGTNDYNSGHYDVAEPGFKDFAVSFMDNLSRYNFEGHDIEAEAIKYIKDIVKPGKVNAMFFSAGKDSCVGLKLLELAGRLKYTSVFMPYSGYDFKEVLDTKATYEDLFDITITEFDNSLGRTYEDDGSYAMMQAKALSNERFAAWYRPDYILIQYRASDEGVRSKDYHISDRGHYTRFSPVFYFSESNIWRFISKYGMPVCSLYFKGYRSLGDEPVTEPCMPVMGTVEDIVKFIESNPGTTERDGRTKQDQSRQFTMEKLRNVGFF